MTRRKKRATRFFPTVIDTNCVFAYFHKDNGTVLDASPNLNHATINGNDGFGVGVDLEGFNFDGSGDYLSITGDTNKPTGNTAFSYMCWFKLDNYSGFEGQGFFAMGSGASNQANGFRTRNDGTEGLYHYFWDDDLGVAATIDNDKWYHTAVTWDGTTRTLYLNGVSIGSDTPGVQNVADTDMYIGSGLSGSGDDLDGTLERMMFFRRAITAQEIYDEYQRFAK